MFYDFSDDKNELILIFLMAEYKDILFYHLYMIFAEERDDLYKYCLDNGVEAKIHYPIPMYMQKAMESYGYQKGDFPVTEECAKKVFSLPMHPYLSNEDQEKIVVGVKDFFNEKHD